MNNKKWWLDDDITSKEIKTDKKIMSSKSSKLTINGLKITKASFGQVGIGRESFGWSQTGGSCSNPVKKRWVCEFFKVRVWQYCFDFGDGSETHKAGLDNFVDMWYEWKI